ncbi:MAG: DUF2934 domain-containing protein [Nitrospiraceae bacterium]
MKRFKIKRGSESEESTTRRTKPKNGQIDEEPDFGVGTKEAERQARIAQQAYALYAQEGYHDGHDVEHWLEAERQVTSEQR